MTDFKIDEIDKQILFYLIKDTRIPFTEIAKKMNVSPGTIHIRIKKLEKANIIKGTSLTIDYEKMDYSFVAYVGILLTKSNKTQKVMEELAHIPNVTVANVIAGKYNIFCKIRAKDNNDAKNVIFKIDEIEDVLRTETMISLEESFNDRNRLLNSIFN